MVRWRTYLSTSESCERSHGCLLNSTAKPSRSEGGSGAGRKVSVVTRTKNRPMLLRRVAATLSRQTFQDFEWVVVNDGGDSEPVDAVVDDGGVAPARVTIVHSDDGVGMEAAANLGVRSTSGAMVVLLDDDDTWEPEFLERVVGFLDSEAGSGFGGVVTQSLYVSEAFDGIHVTELATWPYNPWLRSVTVMELAAANSFPNNSFLFRREVYEAVGGYNEALPVLGDWDFNRRFIQVADVAVIPEPLARYHHRDSSTGVHVPSFANTVVEARDRHLLYTALLRNQAWREGGNEAILSALGYVLDAMRAEIRGGRVSSGPTQPVTVPGGDQYWVALNSLAHSGTLFDRRSWVVRVVLGLLRRMGGRRFGHVPAELTQWARSLTDEIQLMDVEIAPDFDEAAYLRANPDVAEAVRSGGFRHGYHHYLAAGRLEGRSRPSAAL